MIVHECRLDIHLVDQPRVCLRVLKDLGIIQELLGFVDGVDREIGIMLVDCQCLCQNLYVSLGMQRRCEVTYPSDIL